jgi:hypothetical protein
MYQPGTLFTLHNPILNEGRLAVIKDKSGKAKIEFEPVTPNGEYHYGMLTEYKLTRQEMFKLGNALVRISENPEYW